MYAIRSYYVFPLELVLFQFAVDGRHVHAGLAGGLLDVSVGGAQQVAQVAGLEARQRLVVVLAGESYNFV